MKDALGHGSDARAMANRQTAGNHQSGVLRLGRPPGTALIQEREKIPQGTIWHNLMAVGLTSSPRSSNPRAKAERVAMGMSQDKRRVSPFGTDTKMRVR